MKGGLTLHAPWRQRVEEGKPTMQIVGPWLEDHTTIKFAALIEREFGDFVPLKLSRQSYPVWLSK